MRTGLQCDDCLRQSIAALEYFAAVGAGSRIERGLCHRPEPPHIPDGPSNSLSPIPCRFQKFTLRRGGDYQRFEMTPLIVGMGAPHGVGNLFGCVRLAHFEQRRFPLRPKFESFAVHVADLLIIEISPFGMRKPFAAEPHESFGDQAPVVQPGNG